MHPVTFIDVLISLIIELIAQGFKVCNQYSILQVRRKLGESMVKIVNGFKKSRTINYISIS